MKITRKLKLTKGFTLIELLVVIAIIGVLMSIVLTGQSTFNKTIILKNTAYDIALTLRQAETYGMGSRAAGMTANAGYGVNFQAATPGTITLFADTYPSPSAFNCHGLPIGGVSAPDAQPGNCVYDANQSEKVTNYAIGNGITVSNFCAFNGSWECNVSSLDISFSRPNPSTFISTNGHYNSAYSSACLTITSSQGGNRYVSVASSGEITANAASCP